MKKKILSALALLAGQPWMKPLLLQSWMQALSARLLRNVRFSVFAPECEATLTIDALNVRIYNQIVREGAYEPSVSRMVAMRMRPGMTMIDVGANIGYYSVLCVRRGGPTGRVWAVEPDARCRSLLEQNLRQNGIGNVEILPCCAGDTDGFVTFFEAPANALNSVARGNIRGKAESMRVPCLTIDTIAGERKGAVDLMKIDVQGAEFACLRGAERTLEKNPRIELFIEFWPHGLRNAGESPEAMLRFLLDRGFVIDVFDSPCRIRDHATLARCMNDVAAMKCRNIEEYVNLHAYRENT